MNEESKHPAIEPELEARIVALVLGEASDFEREELNRLIEQRPELASFKLRMQSVHGLLQDVGAGEFETPDTDWKLSADKRNAVLAMIRGEATVPATGERINPQGQQRVSARQSLRWKLAGVATVVCVFGFVGMMALSSFFTHKSMQSERMKQLGLATHEIPAIASFHAPRDQEPVVAGSVLRYAVDGEMVVAETDSSQAASVLFSPANRSSIVALSAIRDTLKAEGTLPNVTYLDDDIQYLRGSPDIKLTEEAIAQRDVNVWEKQGRATATTNAATSSSQAVDSPEFIARNDGHWSYQGLRDDDRKGDGLAESKPNGPNVALGALRFPTAADSDGEVNDPAMEVIRLRSDIADRQAVVMDAITELSSADGRHGGESGARPSVITHELEELNVSGMTKGFAIEDRTLNFEDLPSPEEFVSGSQEVAARDFRSKSSALERGFVQERLSGPGESSREFSKGRMAAPADASRIVDGRLGNEDKWMADIEFADTSKPAGGTTDEGLNNLFGDNRSTWDRNGTGGIGGGGLGVNPLWAESQTEIPDTGRGLGTEIGKDFRLVTPDANTPSQAMVSGRESRGETDVDELSVIEGMDVADSLGPSMAAATPGPTDEPVALSLAAKQERNRTAIRKDSESPETDGEHGVRLDGGRGVNTDVNVQDKFATPADTPAFGSRQLSFQGATTDDLVRIQDNQKSKGIQTPVPMTAAGTPAVAGEPTVNGTVNGEDFFAYAESVPSKKKEQQGELQRQYRLQAKGRLGRRYDDDAPTLDDDSDLMTRPAVKRIAPSAGLDEKVAADEAFSTFSLHVSDVSFKLAFAAFVRGEWPEAARVRIEEFVNAFDYGDPLPGKGEKVACRVEQSIHPFVQQRNLLRVSMRTAAAGRSGNTPLRLTFLLDNSGSMERIDRQQTVRRAFALLAQQLTPIDQVTLISFARQPRLLADKVSGAESGQLVRLIDELPSEGGTNIEAALQLAFEKAREQQTPGAQNRIILLTDGAVNLGDANPESLSRMVATMRAAGIAFDAAGISAEGLNDEVLEALTRKGDGRYYLLDSLESADDGFARQIAGALRPSASNVKVQVEFNPKRVGRYKLLGFEKHILKKEDFRNDSVDAAEMAAAEAGVAMYQFEAKADGEGDVGSVSVRFLDLSTGQMIENRWPIPYEANAPRPDQAAPSLRIATSAALLAAKLRGEPLGESVDLQSLSHLISGLPDQDRNNTRVQQLQQMIEQARQLSEK